jgi:hypothetical protein
VRESRHKRPQPRSASRDADVVPIVLRLGSLQTLSPRIARASYREAPPRSIAFSPGASAVPLRHVQESDQCAGPGPGFLDMLNHFASFCHWSKGGGIHQRGSGRRAVRLPLASLPLVVFRPVPLAMPAGTTHLRGG